ncbi:MAG: NupC/NupG family nucleoside CNT transporter [Thermoguttaceae bacterium]|nr:NupC/NupG family nucleoside CNT transporter [Thermoguttaceae bacterium]MDW8078605.1 nucleoside transporter C-terminal domain-containing protein [Thermoguttaceae bacterium]
MAAAISFLGLLVMLVLAWLCSVDRRSMNWRLIISGVALELLLGLILLWTPAGQESYRAAGRFITLINQWSDAGAEFVFGEGIRHSPFAFSVLPVIVFTASLTAILFYLGVLQWIVKVMARIMVWVMDTSGAESLAAAANVFVGMTEAPLVIRPYLASMTRSEIMALMTSGMATIAGSVMAAYAMMLAKVGAEPGHLLAASILSAPAALVIAKIMVPEKEDSLTKGTVRVVVPRQDVNLLDAACRGASEGLKLALNVGAMLVAFVGLVAMVNWFLAGLPHLGGQPITLERILGYLCAPLALVMGVPWDDCVEVGMLLGKKTVLNEFLAYMDLVAMKDQLSPRSFIIATYALCGFSNLGSIAVLIGGLSALEPSRRADFARYGFRSMIGGNLAAFMTGTVAGIFHP